MTGGKFVVAAALFVVAAGSGARARAQGVVPGGWAPQFGYQSFGTPGAGGVGGFATFSYGTPGYGMAGYGAAVGPFGFGATNPYAQGALGAGNVPGVNDRFASPSGRVVNATDPLIDSIRQTNRRRRAR